MFGYEWHPWLYTEDATFLFTSISTSLVITVLVYSGLMRGEEDEGDSDGKH